MVVNDLLNYWLKQGWTQETTICHLHDPLCTCASKSKIAVIDFDAVKRGYEKQHGIASPASVDALRNDETQSDVKQIPQEDYSDLNMQHPHLISCVDFDTCF